MKWIRLWIAILTLVIGLTGSALPTQAQFRFFAQDLESGMGVVLTDNLAGDVNPTPGALTYVGPLGPSTPVVVSTGASKPVVGGVTNLAELNMNGVVVRTGGPGTLSFLLEDTGYIGGPDGPLSLWASLGGVLSAPAGSTITLENWVNPGNLVPALGPDNPIPALSLPPGPNPGGSIGVFTGPFGPGAFAASGSVPFMKSGAYSLFSQVTVFFTGPGTVSFDNTLEVKAAPQAPVPEPSSLIVLASGMAGPLGYLLRRRWKA